MFNVILHLIFLTQLSETVLESLKEPNHTTASLLQCSCIKLLYFSHDQPCVWPARFHRPAGQCWLADCPAVVQQFGRAMCEAHPVCSGTDPDPAEHTPADADGRTGKKKLNVYLYLFILFFSAFFIFLLDVISTSHYNKILPSAYSHLSADSLCFQAVPALSEVTQRWDGARTLRAWR